MNFKIITIILYFIVNLTLVGCLAVYDIKHYLLHKPLFYAYIPISLLSIVPNVLVYNLNIPYVLITSLLSALLLYVSFFIIGLLTNNKLGGGDVKLIPFVAFSFGPYMSFVLLYMALALAVLLIVIGIYWIVCKIRKIPKEEYKKSKVFGPYPAIPFLFIGCLFATAFLFVSLFQ